MTKDKVAFSDKRALIESNILFCTCVTLYYNSVHLAAVSSDGNKYKMEERKMLTL